MSSGCQIAPMQLLHFADFMISETESNFPVHATKSNVALLYVAFSLYCPCFAYPLFLVYRLIFGTLYPAYASYKAVKTKNVKEYVKWMMYWIVFAFFTCAETFADVLVAFWLPFYYEMKILFLVWLLSPATKGSSILYRKFVHPQLNKHEQEIDEYLAKARDQGYSAVVQLGFRGLGYATTVMMQTAIKGQATLVNQIKKSYSTSDLHQPMPRASIQFADPLMEVDSGTEDTGFEEQAMRQRWQSEGNLQMEDTTYDDIPPVRHKEAGDSANTCRRGRSRSVKASRSSSDAGKTAHHDDVAATGYTTLPRAKTAKRKHNLKTM